MIQLVWVEYRLMIDDSISMGLMVDDSKLYYSNPVHPREFSQVTTLVYSSNHFFWKPVK